MDSSLHLHVASLQIQDRIRRADIARLARQAEQERQPVAVTTGAPRGHWSVIHRAIPQSLRRVY